jgi:hypothetical protein
MDSEAFDIMRCHSGRWTGPVGVLVLTTSELKGHTNALRCCIVKADSNRAVAPSTDIPHRG